MFFSATFSLISMFTTIPKVVHQTWKAIIGMPASLSSCVQSFGLVNRNWMQQFYDDEQCITWVRSRFPEAMGTYRSLSTGIHRADFFRILVLYIEGGVYADIDIECLRPLDELIAHLPPGKSLYLTRDHPVHERVHFGGRAMWMNDFMIAAPGDPFLGEVIKWMVANPVSSSSANAVMETGPGVLSAVMEMLGGPEMVPSLGVIPTPWVHPLPDMNCNFAERKVYQQKILDRSWHERGAFVVHYWFHTWVTGAETNTLTDYADVLLSTRGEQVERLLRWELRDCQDETDFLLASALAEFAEQGGSLEVWLGQQSTRMTERLLELLALCSLQPRIQYRRLVEDMSPSTAVLRLEAVGAERLQVSEPFSSGPKLLVIDGVAEVPEVPDFGGLLLGPSIGRGEIIAGNGPLVLTELVHPDKALPRVLHLFPTDARFAEVIGQHMAQADWQVRLWSQEQLSALIQQATLGALNPLSLSDAALECAGALLALEQWGGAVFTGDSLAAAEALRKAKRAILTLDPNLWLFACEAGSPVMSGAFEHWRTGRQRSRAVAPAKATGRTTVQDEHVEPNISLRRFIEIRLRSLQLLGSMGDLQVSARTAMPRLSLL
jgi:mannosyltransferase OCH1-like enzyme